jgi:DNA-binding NarL/FixJ family response regulator
MLQCMRFLSNMTRQECARLRRPRMTSPLRVLIVDDQPLVGSAFARLLPSTLEVIVEVSAQGALDRALAEPFDAVLSDYEMRPHDGLWLLAKLRELRPQMRRVLISGAEPPRIEEHTASGLVDAFVHKPATRRDLMISLGLGSLC